MTDQPDSKQRRKYRDYLDSELEAVHLYTALAEVENDPERADIFRQLVDIEWRHAVKWADRLGIDQDSLDPGKRGLKPRLLKIGARIFGTGQVLPVMLRLEADGINTYSRDPEAADIVEDERRHAATLTGMSEDGVMASIFGPERGHLAGFGNSLRASVMGMNDGLVSNLSLVMGVAGGVDDADIVLLAGTAGLLAGAFSMAAGEYISVRSQRDLHEHQIRQEEAELLENPEEEEEELKLIYRAKGLSEEEAARIASSVMADPEVALDTMAKEELGIDPAGLGSPVIAAISSLLAFAGGAIVPLIPYIAGMGTLSFSMSAVFSGLALALVGGLLGAITGRNPAWGSLRMLIAGGLAAGVTFGIGHLVGATLLG